MKRTPNTNISSRRERQQTKLTYKESKKDAGEKYEQIIELHIHEKASVRTIASKLNTTKSTVSRHIATWKACTTVEEKKPQGRPPKITPRERTFLGQCVAAQEQPTSKSLVSALLTSRNVEVTPQTVRNHLKTLGYKNSLPKKIPLITHVQQQNRLQWCIKHQQYNWKTVWFSDETYFEINRSTTLVWHKKGEKPNIPKSKFVVKIMCWGAISMHFKPNLAIVDTTMNAERYIETLQGYLLHQNSHFDKRKHVFQQDNATCHTATAVKNIFSAKKRTVLAWPANSPDLNPIENIWSILKQNVEKHKVTTKKQLIDAIQLEWGKLSIDLIRKTIESMPKRIKEVIENQGKKCSY